MKASRRNFLQRVALGTGSLLTGFSTLAKVTREEPDQCQLSSHGYDPQHFNMFL